MRSGQRSSTIRSFSICSPRRIRESSGDAVAGIRHATMLYSYLLRPTTANHAFAEVVLRHLNFTLSGAPGERADFLMRLAPILRAEVEKQGLLHLYEKIDLAARARTGAHGSGGRSRRSEGARQASRRKCSRKSATLEKSIYELAGFEFKINSPQQLAEVLFDRLNLQPPRKDARQGTLDGGGRARRVWRSSTKCRRKCCNIAS